MKYLFLFLKKQSFFLLFVLLEVIAIVLLANNNTYHRSNIINTSNVVTGSLYSAYTAMEDYFFLRQENRLLQEENTRLHYLLGNPSEYYDSLVPGDSMFEYIPAAVVSNTSRNRNNFIMINKGRNDGVEKEMGLISTEGVAGIIIEVSANYATALSMLHSNTRISARLKKSGQMVTVVWDGQDYRRGRVEDIPSHIFPAEGDSVLTSGFSFVFPKDIMIGTIGSSVHSAGNFNTAELIFATDFNGLHHVYVSKILAAEELDSLKIPLENE